MAQLKEMEKSVAKDSEKKASAIREVESLIEKARKGAIGDEVELNRLASVRTKLLQNIEERYKPQKEPKTPLTEDQKDAIKEANDLQKYYDKITERVKDLRNSVNGVVNESTKHKFFGMILKMTKI